MVNKINQRINTTLGFIIVFLIAFPLYSYAQHTFLVKRVIDGDTIVVNIFGKKERVRLIGVDTPETKHPRKPVEYYGKEASDFTRRLCEGKRVRLEYDPANRQVKDRDKYGRLLAYVYLADGTFLNAEIIKQGYGYAYTRFQFKYLDEFRKHEKYARQKTLGLWKKVKNP